MDSATMPLPCCFLDESEKLDGGNFPMWKLQVTTILSKYGLLEFLENRQFYQAQHLRMLFIGGGSLMAKFMAFFS